MNEDAITEEQMKLAWQELARQNQTTPERARYEYLHIALDAMTVDNEGNPMPDLVTRRMARELLDATIPMKVDKSVPMNGGEK